MLDLTWVPEILQGQAGRHFEQFELRRVQLGLPPLAEVLPQTVAAEQFHAQLTRAFASSDFLGERCAHDPQLLLDLVRSGELFADGGDALIAQLEAALELCQSDAEFDKTLRELRNKAMVRIIWRDLNRSASFAQTTLELSRFADAAIQLCGQYHYGELEAIHGTPMGQESAMPQPFLVLAMGKLGARELNVSSDIDLIFTFPEAGATQNAQRCLSNQEFFTKLGQRLIKSLDAMSAHGFVFRVDMRLRPHGQSGALVLNFSAMEDYYQTQGRDWERYAMIKARALAAICGRHSSQDYIGSEAYIKQQRQGLRQLLQPFTYRHYIDFSAIESLRDMKALIARQVQRKAMHLDVKLGAGGIREVEFVVQAFQLIRGGRSAALRKRQVLELLPILVQLDYLPAMAASDLAAAYVFLRNTEHALQGYQDRQTQALPADEPGRIRLAWVMGFESWDAFSAVLNQHREAVNREFNAVIAEPQARAQLPDQALGFWQGLWESSSPLQGATPEQAQDLVAEQGETQGAELLAVLRQIRASRSVVSMQASSRTRLDAFIPRLLLALAERPEPKALSLLQALERVVPIVESIARRSAYLVLLIENPIALAQLVQLCAASPWICAQLSQYPALLDELLSPARLYAPPTKEALRDDLRRELLRLGWDDLEGQMEALRYFRSAHALRVAASEVSGTLPLMKVSDYLTFIAEVVLEQVLHLAWEYLVVRHGRPQGAVECSGLSPDFAIIGYGKLGGIELGHGSDLDLVFVHSADPNQMTEGDKPIDNLTFYTRLGQRIIHMLSTQTVSGKLYEVDMRLRPSGNSGMLVPSLAALWRYQQQDAWVWEHQALVRARVVAGSERLAQEFERLRADILQQPRDLPSLRQEVRAMRQKMRSQLGSQAQRSPTQGEIFHLKQDAGGIVDIEFMVQYAALAFARQSPSIIRYTDNIRILEALGEAGLWPSTWVEQMIAAYKAYRSLGHSLALQQAQAVLMGQHPLVREREQVCHIWRELMEVDQQAS